MNLNKITEDLFKQIQSLDFQEEDNFEKRKKQAIEETLKDCSEIDKKRILSEFFSLGPLDQAINDKDVTEILANNWSSVWIEKRGRLISYSSFLTSKTYEQVFHRLCEKANVHLSLKKPSASTSWKGFRLTLTHPPLSPSPTLCLRRKSDHNFDFAELKKREFISSAQEKTLHRIKNEKKNILFIGSTGSGKTTLMNAFFQALPENERVVILEDTDELTLPNSSSLKLLSNELTESGQGQITLHDLMKLSLRLRPERLALGEVRGGEAKDLLLSLSSGHAGGCCTLHASDARQALNRLEMLVQMGAPQWNPATIRQLIHLSVDIIVLCERENGHRRVTGIYSIESLESTGFLLEKIDEDLSVNVDGFT